MIDPGTHFERVVADFCKNNWGVEFVQERRFVDNREVDIIVDTPSELVIIECTIERGKKKAEQDIAKIRDVRKSIIGDASHRPVKGFYITQHDPSPDVHQVAERHGSWIFAKSFPAFISGYNAGTTYLTVRKNRPFGSVRNPANDATELDRSQYIESPFQLTNSTRETLSANTIVSDIINGVGKRLVLTGDFGIGKSMTFRELFFRLADAYNEGRIFRLPLYINLRDGHFEKDDDAIDLIERHAKWAGLRELRSQLVQAWTRNCSIIILDGFDEIARSGFDRLTANSKQIRFASANIVRRLIKETASGTPILISGRESYFASYEEMREALGATGFEHASLQDFSEESVRKLYAKINPRSPDVMIFGWLPQRPLLLSYLYFKYADQLKATHELNPGTPPGEGWHTLLDRICRREAEVPDDARPEQIRRLIERIALYARTDTAEPGRVTGLQISDAYREVAEMEPVESVQQVLMRLPGLSTGGAAEDRRFVDSSFFEAAQAGSLVELIQHLATGDRKVLEFAPVRRLIELFSKTNSVVTGLTSQVAVAMLRSRDSLGALRPALREALRNSHLCNGNLAADVFMCAAHYPEIALGTDLALVVLSGAYFKELEITPDILRNSKIVLRDCAIERLELDIDPTQLNQVEFKGTLVKNLMCNEAIEPKLGELGLLEASPEVVTFDAANLDILNRHEPKYLKTIKVVIRAAFRQQICGRVKTSFYRGTQSLNEALVDECLTLLLKHRVLYVMGNPATKSSVWFPNRAQTRRASMLLQASLSNNDVIIREFASIADEKKLYRI